MNRRTATAVQGDEDGDAGRGTDTVTGGGRDTDPARDQDKVPRGLVAGSIAGVVGCSVVLIVMNSSLVADGAYYLFLAIKTGQPCGTGCAPGRQGINNVREGPLLLAVHQGVTNIHVLAVLEGVGFLIFPAVVWSLVFVLARDSRVRFFLVTVSCGLCFGASIIFSASELTLALPLVILASLLLTQPDPWTGLRAAVAIVSTALLVFSYEGIAPCAVLLGVMAAVRIRVGSGRLDSRASVAVLLLSCAVFGSAVLTLVAWPNPNSKTFVSLPASAVFLFGGAFFLFGWAVLYGRPFGLSKLRWVLLAVAVLFTAEGIVLAIRDGQLAAYLTRGPCVALVGGVQILLLADWIVRRREDWARSWAVRLSSGAAWGAVAFLVALLFVPLVCAVRWSTVVANFRHTVTQHHGIVPATALPTSAGSSYLPGWTNTTLSVLLRSSTSNGVVENTQATPVPFPIGAAEQQIPPAYRWGG